SFQHTTATSLVTDSSTYFLSVNSNQSGFRILEGTNDVASNTLPIEPYFMHTQGQYYRTRINGGFAAVVGEYVYSSSFDKGEYWSSGNIFPSQPLFFTQSNLYVYNAGPASTIRFGASGIALN
ncbi:hypothetical protein, partial [Rhizobium leguminosarum]|uniref:hypothetical protein n=1 Tax=Rhizobium leguminosarum TaxID=384 RepID=UPI003F96EE77